MYISTQYCNKLRPVFVTYHTSGIYYKKSAENLSNSARSLGIPFEVYEISDMVSYWKNTLKKPSFILERLREKKSNIFWIDCDTDLKSDSEFFTSVDTDIVFTSHTGTLEGIKASPIGFSYNGRTIEFLTIWSDRCEELIASNNIDLDHDVLKYEILPQFKNRISASIIGKGTDSKRYTDGDIIFNGISRSPDKEHTMRAVLNKNLMRSYAFNQLNIKDYEL